MGLTFDWYKLFILYIYQKKKKKICSYYTLDLSLQIKIILNVNVISFQLMEYIIVIEAKSRLVPAHGGGCDKKLKWVPLGQHTYQHWKFLGINLTLFLSKKMQVWDIIIVHFGDNNHGW